MPNNRKTRGDSVLDSKLSEAQQEQVFAHCETVPLEAGVAWLRAEFDITLSAGRLGKWLENRRADKAFSATLSSIRADAQRAELINKSFSAAGFTSAASTMIGQCIFEELQKPVELRNEERIAEFIRHMLKAQDLELKEIDQKQTRELKERDQQLKEQAQKLDREKFETDAAKMLLNEALRVRAAEIANSNLSKADQIAAMRKAAFSDVDALEASGKVAIPQ